MSTQLLKTLLQRPVAFHSALGRVAGSAAAGLFLSQLLYWSDKGSHPDGWIWKNANEWEEETCLTPDEQKTSRRKLRELKLVDESNLRSLGINKFSTTAAFRINFDELLKALNGLETRMVIGKRDLPTRGTENPYPKSRKSLPVVLDLPAQCTESTSETTQRHTVAGTEAADGSVCVSDAVFKVMEEYPARRRGDRQEVEQIWQAMLLDQHVEKVLSAIRSAKNSDAWRAESGRYIPRLSKFLRERQFDDEMLTLGYEFDPSRVSHGNNVCSI